MLVSIDEIKVGKRVRKDMGDLEPLKDSMRRYGLLNPITIDSNYRLVAGQRRLEAARAIGWSSISASVIDGETKAQVLEMELEENNQRKEFTNDELLAGYKRLDRLNNPTIFMRIMDWIVGIFTKIARVFNKGKKVKRQE